MHTWIVAFLLPQFCSPAQAHSQSSQNQKHSIKSNGGVATEPHKSSRRWYYQDDFLICHSTLQVIKKSTLWLKIKSQTKSRWVTVLGLAVLWAPDYLAFSFFLLEILHSCAWKRWNFSEAHMSISPSVKTNRLGQSSEIPHGGQSGVGADCIYNAESSRRVVDLKRGGCCTTARANGCHSLWSKGGQICINWHLQHLQYNVWTCHSMFVMHLIWAHQAP